MVSRAKEQPATMDAKSHERVASLIEKRVFTEGYSEVERDTGVEKSQLNRIINGKLNVSPRVARAFGYEQVIIYRKIER